MDDISRTDSPPPRPGKLLASVRRFVPALPLVLLALGCLLGPVFLSSCRPAGTTGIGDSLWQPVSSAGLPQVRVLLTAHPMDFVTVATTGGYRLRANGQVVSESAQPISSVRVSRRGNRWQFNTLSVDALQVTMEPAGEGHLKLNSTAYRGSLRFRAAGEDQVFVINHVDLESYLAGVLPRELFTSWSQETYRSLAIAARTFALYQARNAGPARDYDLGADEDSQVYGGLTAETDKSWLAVRSTHAAVLAYGPAGRERIFLAQYSSCCGGRVNDASVMRNCEDIPPLRGGQVCDDCRPSKRYRWDAVRVTKAEVANALALSYEKARDLGGVSTIRVATATPYGRNVWIDVLGVQPGKSVRVRAEDLRLALLRARVPAAKSLFSMNCQINDVGDAFTFTDGRGYGHGVGLCQWGAEGKAQRGWKGEQIVLYYYPQARLMKAY